MKIEDKDKKVSELQKEVLDDVREAFTTFADKSIVSDEDLKKIVLGMGENEEDPDEHLTPARGQTKLNLDMLDNLATTLGIPSQYIISPSTTTNSPQRSKGWLDSTGVAYTYSNTTDPPVYAPRFTRVVEVEGLKAENEALRKEIDELKDLIKILINGEDD